MEKFVYSFNEGSKDMRNLLGGKGANLSEMTKIGLPVPFGFTIITDVCNRYYNENCEIAEEIAEQIFEKLSELENVTGKVFGDVSNPLLVAVRSGSVFSMPGMMDTVLNLGMNDEITAGLAAVTGNERFAFDSYRRFLQVFGSVVLQVPKVKFDEIFEAHKAEKGFRFDVELSVAHLKEIVVDFKALIEAESGNSFTKDPKVQLMEAIKAVFRSWNNERAVLYRQLNNISSSLGTAVTIQSMVFGNMGSDSGTGVAFTRNPVDGRREVFGEFLANAQGEDVVAGIRTPRSISNMAETFPTVYKEFIRISELLENHFTDMQNMEFTVEKNKLFMLQSRNGKRTAAAAVKIAVDMERDGLIGKKTAVMRLEPAQIDRLLYPMFNTYELEKAQILVKGLPASPGAVTGRICFNTEDAALLSAKGDKAILVRVETSTKDLAGIIVAEGILTSRGGMTSHAVVIARSMGKCCVSGCSDIIVDEKEKTLTIGENVFSQGQYISLDGTSGNVYKGKLNTISPELSEDFQTVMKWADEIRVLKVRANVDSYKDAKLAVKLGAEGIGLCRTEHMFYEEEKLLALQSLLFVNNVNKRKAILKKLFSCQKEDIKDIFEVMGDRPVTIRLLDPSLQEFLPHSEVEIQNLAEELKLSPKTIAGRVGELHEINPLLGHRGCRLIVTYPEIAQMQTEAIITAVIEIKKEREIDIVPEIMIPLVGLERELAFIKNIVVEAINRCFEEHGISINYLIGTMIEVPRAALTADEIAKEADFFSFGTNDLTQLTYGLSRSGGGKIISEYRSKLIFEDNPFETIDKNGVGKLIKMAVELGKNVRPNIKMGLCGEHGGDSKTVEFCHHIGLNSVSCLPYRVPTARLAAAQAALKEKEQFLK